MLKTKTRNRLVCRVSQTRLQVDERIVPVSFENRNPYSEYVIPNPRYIGFVIQRLVGTGRDLSLPAYHKK